MIDLSSVQTYISGVNILPNKVGKNIREFLKI